MSSNSKSYNWFLNWFTQWKQKPEKKEDEVEPRPSITVSIASDRTQQTTGSWTSDDQSRRDSMDIRAKKRYFHWPHRHSPRTYETDFFRHRHSVSSTPSILSPPCSPHFAPFIPEEEISHCLLEEHRKERWKMNPDLIKLVLDGCGDAAWALDIASAYPRWNVIGLEDHKSCRALLPSHIPKNFQWIECEDLLQGLKRLPSNSFDFISCRFLLFSLSLETYRQVVDACRRLLKPESGYVECIELDLRIYYQRLVSVPTQASGLNSALMEQIELDGRDPRLGRKLQKMGESGYISIPLGIWGGKLGVMFKDDLYVLMETVLKDRQQIPALEKELDLNRAFMNLHLVVIPS
ncbi:hypothetical protein BY458DRAFT_536276 [Sporodiniella umbellata]|nr:hypothetical protein BY458DRAFT_536276 [Sporodiniella umbellata]